MSPEDELFIICMRQDFSLEHRQKVSRLLNGPELHWDEILSTALAQGVAPLLRMNLVQCSPEKIGVPADVMEQLQLSEVRATAVEGFRAARLEGLLSFLNSKSIETMLIKGTALKLLVYDRPWTTTSNDIDLILGIETETFTGAERAEFDALASGYSLEYDFMEHHDVTMNNTLPIDFRRIWTDATPINYRGQPCHIMAVEDMLIALCINSCRKRYFRIRSLFDIAETIRRRQDISWQLVAEKARSYQCNTIVYAALLVTQITLGCQLPAALRQDLAVSPLRERVIRYGIEKRASQPLFRQKASREILGRTADISVLLPYLSYRGDQIVRRSRTVWRTRKNPMGLIGLKQQEAITRE